MRRFVLVPLHRHRPSTAIRGFTLVELLTVVFIISLLIAILVPALSSARTAAKVSATKQAFSAINTGMEAFRNENGSSFIQTNGYPPSFVHPPIWSDNTSLDAKELAKGKFPFVKGYPIAYGAHWLPAALIGIDSKGYIKPGSVPDTQGLRLKPEEWYTADPTAGGPPIPRAGLYCDPGGLRTVLTKDLPGQVKTEEFWLDRNSWGDSKIPSVGRLPVIVDAFDYPVLYYVANKNGQSTNMVAVSHDANNDYPGSKEQTKGVPYYFHDDNVGFTGRDDDNDIKNGVDKPGWDLAGLHPIAATGADLNASELMKNDVHGKVVTFARYLLDRKIHRDLSSQDEAAINPATPLRPVNADSYILWSPGADGKWGTTDDISNMPPFTE